MYCSLWGGSGEDGGLRYLVLADSPYLVAMALIDQQGRRALPLGGRSQKEVAPQGEAPEALGHALVLELLLRVWQRSDQGVLQRAAGADSLLLVELPMERLPEDHVAIFYVTPGRYSGEGGAWLDKSFFVQQGARLAGADYQA